MSWKDGRSLCHKLGGGNITEAKSNNQLGHLMTLFNYMNSSCEYIWTPLFDEEEEGVFISSVTGHVSSYLPWQVNQPNGGSEENCVAVRSSDKSYYDVPCSYKYCVSCDVFKITVFKLMGVCADSYLGRNAFSFNLF